jgi:hypothetical protein
VDKTIPVGNEHFYERPPLSKGFLSGKSANAMAPPL